MVRQHMARRDAKNWQRRTRQERRTMPVHSNISLRVSRGVVLFGIAALVGWIGADADAGTVRRAKAITNEQTISDTTLFRSVSIKMSDVTILQFYSASVTEISTLSYLSYESWKRSTSEK